MKIGFIIELITSKKGGAFILWISILVGIALSCATSFRIFLPMLFLSLSWRFDWLTIPSGFEWLESNTALIILIIATVIEIIAYLIPFFDSILDAIDMPIAIIASILLMSSVVQVDAGLTKWLLVILIGAPIPALIKTFKALLRAQVSVVTLGFGNSLFAIFELFASGCIAIIAIQYLAQ